jgi:hypothetical protein
MIAQPPCVIAHHYSSANFVSMRFHCRKEKFGARFKNYISFLLIFLKFRKSEIA